MIATGLGAWHAPRMKKSIQGLAKLVLFAAVAAAGGCSGGDPVPGSDGGVTDGGTEPEVSLPEEHACDHAQYGPDAAVTAGETAAAAPTISEGMHRYTIALPSDGAGAYAGVILLDVQEMGMWHFAPPEGVTLRLSSDAGAVSVQEEAPQSCPELVTRLVGAMLDVGTYTVELTGTEAEVVMVIVSPVGDHTHMDEAGM